MASVTETLKGAFERSMAKVGERAAGDVKNAISDGVGPAPSPTTLALRRRAGFQGTKQLTVTGQLRNAVTSRTKKR